MEEQKLEETPPVEAPAEELDNLDSTTKASAEEEKPEPEKDWSHAQEIPLKDKYRRGMRYKKARRAKKEK